MVSPTLPLRLSNLIPRPGFSPGVSTPDAQTQWVQVRDLTASTTLAAPPDNNDEIDLRELWYALRRRRKLVATTAAAVVALAAVITLAQRVLSPQYQGSFTLLISDPINSEGKAGAPSLPEGGVFDQLARNTTQADLPTLIEVLRSPLLLNPVAQAFDLDPKSLAKRITISIGGEKRSEAEGILNISYIGNSPEEDQRLLSKLADTYLQAALTQRQQRLADGIRFLDRQAPALQQRTAELQQELARFRQRHNLLEPTAEGTALRVKAEQQREQLLQLEAERARLLAVRRGVANGSLTARGFQEALGTGPNTTGLGGQASSGLAIAGANQSLLEQLTKLDDQLADARSRYTASSSVVQGLQARRRQLLPLLQRNQLEAVDAALSLNASRLATARRQQLQLDQTYGKQPELIKQYDALQQRLTIAQDNLAGFLKTRETFQLEIAQRTVPWKVIAPPLINPNPVKPSVPRNLALGVVLGLVAGAGAGLLRDRLDHVFHNPVEVQEGLKLPLLGHIPHVAFFKGVREDNRFLIEELDQGLNDAGDDNGKLSGYQRFFYQEAFRNLFTSLRFLSSDKPLRSIALTSSMPAEGKTLINVLLAKTLSEMGQRVLLVDADLRKPQLHHRLGVNNLLGLSNLLTEDDLHWRQALQTVANYESWWVITAGRVPPDPTRLLSSARMAQLVRDLADSGEFDLIVYDTPPVLGLADAALVAEQIDGLMLLVSLDRVDRSLPKEAVARIRSSGAPLLGLVTNAVKEQRHGSSAYGYGYGYGKYGYGYGGYGYGAYNPGTTYAYYASGDDEANGRNNTQGANKGLPAGNDKGTPLQQLKHQLNRFWAWVDR